MKISKESTDKSINEVKPSNIGFVLLIVTFFLLVTFIFLLSSHLGSPSDSKGLTVFSYTKADLGTLGDLLGGALNPLLSFFTICLLVYSIHIQIDELRETKKQLIETNSHHQANLDQQLHLFETQRCLENLNQVEKSHKATLNIILAPAYSWNIASVKQNYDLTIDKALSLPGFSDGLERDLIKKLLEGMASFNVLEFMISKIISDFEDKKIAPYYYNYQCLNLTGETLGKIKKAIDLAERKDIKHKLQYCVDRYDVIHSHMFDSFFNLNKSNFPNPD